MRTISPLASACGPHLTVCLSPLRRPLRAVRCAFCLAIMLSHWCLQSDSVTDACPRPAANITCAEAWCDTNAFDVAITAAVARGGFDAAALVSHVLNFGVSPLLALGSFAVPLVRYGT